MLVRIGDVWLNPDHVVCIEGSAIVGVSEVRMAVGDSFATSEPMNDVARRLNKQAVAGGRARPVARKASARTPRRKA